MEATTTEIPTPAEYWDMLNRHDWYYSFSDDGRVYRRGMNNQARLRQLADTSPEHRALYDGFRAQVDANIEGVAREDQPARPERPADNLNQRRD